MQEIEKSKTLSKDFAPKIVPLIQGLNARFLDNIQYPMYIQPLPSGVKIFIRAGFLRFADNSIVKNLELKSSIDLLIEKSRRMKVTYECIISGRHSEIDNNNIKSILCDYQGEVNNLQLYVMDMIFENSPEALEYSVRANSLKHFVNVKEVGTFPKLLAASIVRSRKDFEEYVNSYVMFDGFKNFIIAAPKSKYKFGDVEDLFNGTGGIAQINGDIEFKAKIIEIIPKILNVKGKDIYVASSLKVNYCGQTIELSLEKKSIIITSKTWENRNELNDHFAVFTGILLPGYKYPKYREFQRFERDR
jgi:hypothetical protein